ncbi:MAG: DinB family protein [Cyclobacteriaceae bacterium]
MKTILALSALIMSTSLIAQDFFKTIPKAPSHYTANTVAIRMIDGLGFRYYWATEGLTEKDLTYRIGEDSRTVRETLEHIAGLSAMTASAIEGIQYQQPAGLEKMSWEDVRKLTLGQLASARNLLVEEKDVSEAIIDFGNGRTFPFWNAINGPIEDAIWHTGQVVMLRRAAGNPFPKGVSVFTGRQQSK